MCSRIVRSFGRRKKEGGKRARAIMAIAMMISWIEVLTRHIIESKEGIARRV